MSAAEDRSPTELGVLTTGTILATVAVALRFWVRGHVIRKFRPDDWVVLASLVLLCVSFGLIVASCSYGLGKHMNTLDDDSRTNALKLLYIAFMFTPFAEAAAKISITLMLMHITTSKVWKWTFKTVIIIMLMITIWDIFSYLACHPTEIYWDYSVSGWCDDLELVAILYAQGVAAAAYDVLLAVSPIVLLWKVKIDRRSKWLLCGLLSLGFFTSAAGIVRTALSPDALKVNDTTWDMMEFLIWKSVELPLSIIVGCLPTLRPLFDKNYTTTSRSKSTQRLCDEPDISRRGAKTYLQGNGIEKTVDVDIHSTTVSFESPDLKQPGFEPQEVV